MKERFDSTEESAKRRPSGLLGMVGSPSVLFKDLWSMSLLEEDSLRLSRNKRAIRISDSVTSCIKRISSKWPSKRSSAYLFASMQRIVFRIAKNIRSNS